MAYLPELHTCCVCKADLGPDDGDGICWDCDNGTYCIMDGRARFRPDRAVVLETCESYDEATGTITEYGTDSVIVLIAADGREFICGSHPDWKE